MLKIHMQSIVVLMDKDISFKVSDADNNDYQFLLSREAIDDAVGFRGNGEDIDRYEVFIGRLDRISEIAEKMIRAGIKTEPIVITTKLFNG